MTADDAPALLEFYRSLPPEDLLYLREDVTKPESMTRWVESIESEQGWHLLAGYEGRIIADGELDHQFYGWSRHVGELRIVIDPNVSWERSQYGHCSGSVGAGRRRRLAQGDSPDNG
jgi:hypothetical protein